MKIKFIILALILLSACSQTPKKPAFNESFVTHIELDGTKKFSYSLISLKPGNNIPQKGKGKGRHQGQGKGSYGQGKRKSDNRPPKGNGKMLNQRLEKILSETGYCQQGYTELDTYNDREISQFTGQCEEKASDTERERFPNQ